MYLKIMYRVHCACSHSSQNSNKNGGIQVFVESWMSIIITFRFTCKISRKLVGTGAMFVGAQKKLPKKERGRKEKGEDYIISHLLNYLIENHYKNG